jgi:hypothetical protein
MLRPLVPTRRAAGALLAAAAFAAAACGRGDNQSADRNGADTTSADTSATGTFPAPVGSNKPATDSSFAAASQRLDSLRDAGRTPANGIDSMGSRVQATTANEPGADTSRLNNRATPGGKAADGRQAPR